MTGISRKSLYLLAAVSLLCAALLAGPGAAGAGAAKCKNSDTPAYKLSHKKARRATLCLINRERSSHHMRGLRPQRHQERAAARHNGVMVRKNCFSHQCPGEKDLVGRITSAGYLPCTCSWSIAENIAWGAGSQSSPRRIVDMWMHSAPHRAAILNPTFEDIGVAVSDGSPGGPNQAATFTTDFGFKH
jgi:uncharacterized protein YkwD